MKIALLGYGKMGKEIEKIALQRNHEIVIKSSGKENYDISLADVAIDFSTPLSAFKNVCHCIENHIPVVCGTTGWLDKYKKVVDLCNQKNGAFIYASNFSLGVNIFFQLNVQLAKMMKPLTDYNVSIEEIHHTQKLDAPSGTAITLAEEIIKNSDKLQWELNKTSSKKNIPIKAQRISNVHGTHIVSYNSQIDSIEIKHKAYNRKGFALGAVIATEWLLNKTGVFTMKDVLNINQKQ